jgi:hypothetical protein
MDERNTVADEEVGEDVTRNNRFRKYYSTQLSVYIRWLHSRVLSSFCDT